MSDLIEELEIVIEPYVECDTYTARMIAEIILPIIQRRELEAARKMQEQADTQVAVMMIGYENKPEIIKVLAYIQGRIQAVDLEYLVGHKPQEQHATIIGDQSGTGAPHDSPLRSGHQRPA